jgi:PilZ domain
VSHVGPRTPEVIRTSPPTALTLVRPIAEAHDDSDPLERRMMVRSIPLESRASLGWWEGIEFVNFAARLLDISRAGVALEMDHRPPNDRDVWFRLQSQPKTDALCGEVVDVKAEPRGRHIVRIAFWSPYPERLYREALHGPLNGESRPGPSAA